MFVLLDEPCNVSKLSIPIRGMATGQDFLNLPQAKILCIHPLADDIIAGWRSQACKLFLQPRWRQVRKHDFWGVRISASSRLENRFQILFGVGIGSDPFFRPAPGRLTRPAAGSFGSVSSSFIPRLMVLVEQPRIFATNTIPPRPNRWASIAAYRRLSFSERV